jgi:biopolymer transport protein ExbB
MGAGKLPFDASQGNALKVEAIEETVVEHFLAGGPIMWPILVLAVAAFLVALYKWGSMTVLRMPSRKQVDGLVEALAARDEKLAKERVGAIRGPIGEMLSVGVAHLREPKELVEEVMYEKMLATKLKLNSLLPFVAISASAAPLLGLLGTVTGIMNTFSLMTVFGTGDVKTLSSGISEALITTEYGLIVAIPSLLLHAFLARKARGVQDEMEKAAIAMMNQVAKTPLAEAA